MKTLAITTVALVAATAACTKQHKSAVPGQKAQAIAPASENLFAKQELRTAPALSTVFSTHQTSLTGSALDAEAVERVIRARLTEATREALGDLFEKAGLSAGNKPARDLTATVASLVADVFDGDARSQTLVAAITRDGLAAWAAALGADGLIDGGTTCSADPDQLLDAAYEGLASSAYLRPLGFPESDGTFATLECATFGGNVAMLVDTIARFPDPTAGSIATLTTQFANVGTAIGVNGACTKVAGMLPLEVQTAVTAASKTNLESLRGLYNAIKNTRQLANTYNGALKDEVRSCYTTLLSFSDAFERTVLRFSADFTAAIDLADVTSMLTAVDARVQAIKAQHGAEIAAVQSLLMRLVDGRALRRGDVVTLVKFISGRLVPKLEKMRPAVAKEIMIEVLAVLPESIREDATAAAGILLDVSALASTVLSEFSRRTRGGFYLRATVGTGYALFAGTGSRASATTTSVHEEIGLGYRWHDGPVLHGPHAIVSGLLYNILEDGETSNRVFLGVGYSANLYRLVDVSASIGRMTDLDGTSDDYAALIGLQIPLFDYLSALQSGNSIGQTSVVGGK